MGGRGLNRWAEAERTREERKQGACSCSIFKVCIIRLVLTRGPGLMKLFLLFSLTLCSRLPECLSLSLSFSALRSSSSFCVYLPFSYLLTSVSSLTALFVRLAPFPIALCSLSAPRWIIAPRTAQPTQVLIMSLRREPCCSSQEKPSKVKNNIHCIMCLQKHMSLRLNIEEVTHRKFFLLAPTEK